MATRYQLSGKVEVYHLIKLALEPLGRADEPSSYGVAPDTEDAGRQIIYFDLPRVSPLQFNVTTGAHLTHEDIIRIIRAAITRRIEISANSS